MFSHITKEEVLKEVGNLDTTKSSQDTVIPIKIIKQNSDIFASFIFQSFNNMIDSSTFPAALKLAHISPVFKKDSKSSKKNYRPVSILPNISKISERCTYKQMSDYLPNFYSKLSVWISPRHSFVSNCSGWGGGGQTAHFWEKKPSSSFNYYKRMT